MTPFSFILNRNCQANIYLRLRGKNDFTICKTNKLCIPFGKLRNEFFPIDMLRMFGKYWNGSVEVVSIWLLSSTIEVTVVEPSTLCKNGTSVLGYNSVNGSKENTLANRCSWDIRKMP